MSAYERVLGAPLREDDEDMIWRKDIRHPRLVTVNSRTLGDVARRIADGDPNVLTTGATSHWLDIGLASRLNSAAKANLRRWATEGETSTLRANAISVLGIGAGLRSEITLVIKVLENDTRVRDLCVASVVSRTLQLDWPQSRAIMQDPASAPQPRRLAKAMAREAIDRRSVQSRWIGTHVLRQLVPVLG